MTKIIHIKPTNIKNSAKKGSHKPLAQSNFANGLNRRAFLKASGTTSLVVALAACKPSVPTLDNRGPAAPNITTGESTAALFDDRQRQVIEAVQQILFPDDGDGPSAKQLNAFGYLEFAMTDKKNIADGDPTFIIKGVGWLSDLAQQTQGESFLNLDSQKQEAILHQIASSSAGENWLSLLLYYLVEALLLDPVYGGNNDEIGWQWLEHQPGFPGPVVGKTYRDFD